MSTPTSTPTSTTNFSSSPIGTMPQLTIPAYDRTTDPTLARNKIIRQKLIVQYMEKFKMDASTAAREVARDMAEKYPDNPWDGAPRGKGMLGGRWEVVEKGAGSERKEEAYGKEMWDLFERRFA